MKIKHYLPVLSSICLLLVLGFVRTSKRVGGGLKKVVKRAIDPSEAEVEEAIEAILTPTACRHP